MSAFPGLEAALDTAASRRFGGRRPRPWGRWVAAPALTVCAAALVVALLPARTAEPGVAASEPPVTVPAAALARSDALTRAPDLAMPGEPVEHARLRAVATQIATRVPHPPGAGESMNWEATPRSSADMASIGRREAVQMLVEFRAACTWATFWLFALAQGNAPALASATAVLQDVPHWPSHRASRADPFERTQGWNAVAPAAAAGDARPVREYAGANCAMVPSPWSDVIR